MEIIHKTVLIVINSVKCNLSINAILDVKEVQTYCPIVSFIKAVAHGLHRMMYEKKNKNKTKPTQTISTLDLIPQSGNFLKKKAMQEMTFSFFFFFCYF